MHAPKKSGFIYLMVIVAMTCAFCAFAAIAAAAPTTASVSLSELAAPQAVAAENMPTPSMPFAPSYYGTKAVDGKYPSNGAEYVKDGTSTLSRQGVDEQGVDGRGPHGGYDTASNKCGVCHAAHSATTSAASAGVVSVSDGHLLRAGVTGCEYCHVGTGLLSNDAVYTSNNGNVADLGTGNSGHAITGQPVAVPASKEANATMTLSCASCHSVHGTIDNWRPADFFNRSTGMTSAQWGYKLLLANPGGKATPVPTAATSHIEDPGTDPSAVNQFALSYWCASCHDAAQVVQVGSPTVNAFTASTADSKTTHKQVTGGGTSLAEGISGPHNTMMQGMGTGASQCYTCHRGGLSAESPVSDGQTEEMLGNLLYSPVTTDTQSCSICHYGTADYATDPAVLNGTSDWPHSSTNDVDLLGSWTVEFPATGDDVTVKTTPVTSATKQRLVCGRCHPVLSSSSDSIDFALSEHTMDHTYPMNSDTGLWNTKGTTGTLDDYYSLGYEN